MGNVRASEGEVRSNRREVATDAVVDEREDVVDVLLKTTVVVGKSASRMRECSARIGRSGSASPMRATADSSSHRRAHLRRRTLPLQATESKRHGREADQTSGGRFAAR